MDVCVKVVKLVEFWLIFITVNLPKWLHLYTSWLSGVLAFCDILHTVLNSAGFFFMLKWSYNNFWGLCLVSIIYFCKKIFINPPFSFILLTFLSNFYLNHRDKDGSFLYSSAKLDLLLWPVSVWLKANLSPFYWLLVKHVFLCFPFSFCIVLWKYVTSLQAVKNYPPTGKKKMTTVNPIQEKVYVFN